MNLSEIEVKKFNTCSNLETLLFILTANGGFPDGSGTEIRPNTQVTHITQN
jgi:hypothetical protein